MPNPWFRMYTEFANDPKVQIMPEHMQRRLLMLFCSKCANVTVASRERETAFHWRISDIELSETKTLFIEQGFIDEDWNVMNWDRRQFISDSSSERTKRYRERARTSQERHSSGDVTKCDAIDTEQNRTEQKKIRKVATAPEKPQLPEWLPEDLWVSFVESRKAAKKPFTTLHAQELAIKSLIKYREAGYDTTAIIEKSVERGWMGFVVNEETPKLKKVYRIMTPEESRASLLEGMTQ